ncbi:MAG: efflux RND transporter periplasmic adaptor subunit [Desulfomonilaceae bacterium]
MDDSYTTDLWARIPAKKLLLALLIILAFVLGYWLPKNSDTKVACVDPKDKSQKISTVADAHDHLLAGSSKKAEKAKWWTCSMHPQIKLPHPGKCPICAMDLIPVTSSQDTDNGTNLIRYTMSEAARKLAEVQTTTVKRGHAKVRVRMVGLVDQDETRVAYLTSRVAGRLDQIYVNYTGNLVNKGDPMVTIWSPTLITSQVELFESMRSEDSEDIIKGAEEKLMQYGMTKKQIDDIEKQKKPDLYVTLRAPISGVVTKKTAILGQFVKEGSEMYTINDLSHVWVMLDAYESDMPWIRYGQDVTFTTSAVPGRKFKGKVMFLDPVLDTKTRTVKIRVEADNPDYSLRPGMFVTAELKAEVDSKGRVIKSEWAGKYICPVHPSDQVSSKPGICPISKMALRPCSAYGYVDDPNPKLPLVIPAAAPLITGKRSIVYVEVPNQDKPTYELREVVLGPRAGDKYVVYQGLKEGDRVVTTGNFEIDSAMQIVGKASMMNPIEPKQAAAPNAANASNPSKEDADEEVIQKLQAPEKFVCALTPVIQEYLNLKESLVSEKSEEAAVHAKKLAGLVKELSAQGLNDKCGKTWKKLSMSMLTNLKQIADTQDIGSMRKGFDPLSEAFAKVVMGFRHTMKNPLFLYHCPMAFDNEGAYWVESSKNARNPYFGKTPYKGQQMLKCGEMVEKIPPETFPSLDKAKGTKEPQVKSSTPKQGNDSTVTKDKQDAEPTTTKDKQEPGAKPKTTSAGSHSTQNGREK